LSDAVSLIAHVTQDVDLLKPTPEDLRDPRMNMAIDAMVIIIASALSRLSRLIATRTAAAA
jgi:hypothetical protein